jgi:GxxExxY protein
MTLNELSFRIIGIAMRVHTELGTGLREEVYEAALAAELERAGHTVRRQVSMSITIAGHHIGKAARADLIVDDQIVVEVKAVRSIGLHHIRQVRTYLKLLGLKLGLIFNFDSPSLRHGIRRVVNDFEDEVVNQGL